MESKDPKHTKSKLLVKVASPGVLFNPTVLLRPKFPLVIAMVLYH